jgi:hypothetical protein
MKEITLKDTPYSVVEHTAYEGGHRLVCEDGQVFIVFKSKEIAGDASKSYWLAIAAQKPLYFLEVIGRGHSNPYAVAGEILLKWAMNLPAGPGNAKTKSLFEWLDLLEKEPHYGKECSAKLSPELAKELKMPIEVICYE